MLKKLIESCRYNGWQKEDPRFARLDMRDRFLDGTAYDHLHYPFSQEEDNGRYIPIYDRRPSVVYPLANLIARICSRKLFSGRFTPRLVHKNEKLKEALERLVEEADLENLMMEIVHRGSVGSVLVTYKIVNESKGGVIDPETGKIVCEVWKSKFCNPKFDQRGNLKAVRIAYPVVGIDWIKREIVRDAEGKEIQPTTNYWFIKDITDTHEIEYVPILENQWSPSKRDEGLKKRLEMEHKVGFCQGQWFVNSTSGSHPDGACTFGPIMNIMIEIDYTMSQLGRAVRYNAAPQIVCQGELVEFDDERGSSKVRSPHVMLMFRETIKESDGTVIEGGDAKLLEMTGEGITVGLALIERLRKMAMECAAAVRKDPDHAGTLITGKAMEALDEDLIGLLMELRTAYGTRGYLKLIKRIAMAAAAANHPLMRGVDLTELDGLTLQWPPLHLPTPQEMLQLVQAMSQAVGTPGKPGANGAPGTPAGPELIKKEDASAYLYNVFDMPIFSYNRVEENVQEDDSGEGSTETKIDESNVVANELPAA